MAKKTWVKRCGTNAKYVSGCRCDACKRANADYCVKWRKSRPTEMRALYRQANLKRLYNLTIEQYNQMFEAQKGVCAICGRGMTNGLWLPVDHCHKSGEVRGLLCFSCNGNLGWFELYSESISKYLKGN